MAFGDAIRGHETGFNSAIDVPQDATPRDKLIAYTGRIPN